MLHVQAFQPPYPIEFTPTAMPNHPMDHSKQRRLRHYLVGSPTDTQHAIDRLHRLGYLDRLNWIHTIEIPENGLIIRPDPGEVLRYTQRDSPRLDRDDSF